MTRAMECCLECYAFSSFKFDQVREACFYKWIGSSIKKKSRLV